MKWIFHGFRESLPYLHCACTCRIYVKVILPGKLHYTSLTVYGAPWCIYVILKVNDMIGRNKKCLVAQIGWKIYKRYNSCNVPHGWICLEIACIRRIEHEQLNIPTLKKYHSMTHVDFIETYTTVYILMVILSQWVNIWRQFFSQKTRCWSVQNELHTFCYKAGNIVAFCMFVRTITSLIIH